MPYKDPERRRACNRDSVRRLREQRKAAADKREAVPPGEKPCIGCQRRRSTIRFRDSWTTSQLCRTCARDAVQWMAGQLFSTTEPESQERCRLCPRHAVNVATVSILRGRPPQLCRLCAAEAAGCMMRKLATPARWGYAHAA